MKSELKENMYVRTKDGEIHKIKSINDEYIEYENGFGIPYELKEYIVKASYNIIDILEVEDFVSTITGECAVIAGVYNDINSKKYLRLCNCIGEYYEDDIKSVITHEQMEQMAYKVGE